MENRELRKCSHIEAIRMLTGAYRPEHASTIIHVVNLIARDYKKLDSDIIGVDPDFFAKQMAMCGLDIVRD